MNMIVNPNMLPKVRSDALMAECANMPCELRLASFIGLPCEPQETVVGCHVEGSIGKGTSTKVSDVFVAAGCRLCHDLLAGVDPRGMEIARLYPSAFWHQVMRAQQATMSRWIMAGLVVIPDGKII
ncbi:hypothetical protein [Ruegeria lacuscaerulensis]|uniref:hypothetical protein n=1 Tax=Ruegeria lacuscaerulensis TaxID=55218 RepID=UPI00147AA97E|nr:hypothetical protein [Ruegeria lacuscaerulensis]